jgi:tRNA (uracil-5-)-methyltransferase
MWSRALSFTVRFLPQLSAPSRAIVPRPFRLISSSPMSDQVSEVHDVPLSATADLPDVTELEGSGDDQAQGPTMLSETRVVVRNLPGFLSMKEFDKILRGLNPPLPGYVKCRKPPKIQTGFILLETDENVLEAIRRLNGFVFKGRPWEVEKADKFVPKARPEKRARIADDEVEGPSKEGKVASIVDRTAPLHRMPYDEQLQRKLAYLRNEVAAKLSPSLAVHEILPSPDLYGYRNKVEYSLGLGSDNLPVCGFSEGRPVNGVTTVGSPDECPHISNLSKGVATIATEFLRAYATPTSELYGGVLRIRGIRSREDYTGFWYTITLRENSQKEALILVSVSPAADAEQQVTAFSDFLRSRWQTTFADIEPAAVLAGVTMFVTGSKKEPSVIFGKNTVEETLTVNGVSLNFAISPQSFFQVNRRGAEVLYGKTIDHVGRLIKRYRDAGDTSPILCLDVCCGTGTIGLLMASIPDVSKVLGVDIIQSAVDDAKENARQNKLDSKCTFIAGKAESVLTVPFLSRQAEGHRVIAVVDPPRAGLHHSVLWALRKCESIESIVYVSCNQESLVKNCETALCKSNVDNGNKTPFITVELTGVDMFPHTDHVEAIAVLQRVVAP